MISMIIMIKIIGLNYLIMLIKRLSTTVFRSHYKNYFISKNKWDYSFWRKLDHTHFTCIEALPLQHIQKAMLALGLRIKHTALYRQPLMRKPELVTINTIMDTHMHPCSHTHTYRKKHKMASH
jgi:hypothetical protein